MKLLLTGADGFTGRHFRGQAEKFGYEVVDLKSDLLNRSALDDEVNEVMPDAVVHLAAISFVGHADESAFYSVNVVGTMNLISSLSSLEKKPNKVLIASSANVYGNTNLSPIDENVIPNPSNHYAMSKLAMEKMVHNFADRLPIIITRPFNYTGKGQNNAFLIPKIVSHFSKSLNTVNLGNINVEREFNDVRMVCSAYLQLLEKGISGEIYNICTGKAFTLNHILSTLENITGKKLNVNIDNDLIRKNEIATLFGNPRKLFNCTGEINNYSLEETLKWMIEE
jgi:nucleoside-diphosphate-sugar epimerase